MIYAIHITRAAERDLNTAADYIEFVLLNPQAADDLLNEAEKKIRELSDFPEKSSLVDDPVLKAWGIRFTIIKNYIAFYVVSEETHTIFIVRFLYKKRDWLTILKQDISLL
ncbi:type II toxin-antitoxin system RelE/ParE family toxin [[Clostridium] aminophilum]|uniref:type II toxin-antitoxin system RelE/ParE family toxin n=1 Tax=[Clostridium] aminophilum TaxID=1526 RepID=UPI0033269398